jgi:hypothetical protein
MSAVALYRHFDAAGRLLYVGISLSAVQRLGQHKAGARWFGEIANVTIEWMGSRDDATAAELRAIRSENPAWNVAGRLQPKVWRRAAPRARKAWAVLHVDSGLLDGPYLGDDGNEEAEAMMRLLATRYECDDFVVLAIPKHEAVTWACGHDIWAARGWSMTAGAKKSALHVDRAERLLSLPTNIGTACLRAILRHEKPVRLAPRFGEASA